MDLTQPVASNAHGAQSMPVDRAVSPARTRGVQKESTEDTDTGEDWLHAATADPAFWLKKCGR